MDENWFNTPVPLARKKALSTYMRPFIQETVEKHMPVEDGLKFLDEKRKLFDPNALSYAKGKRTDLK
jgi:hypothetical protein